MVISSLHLTTQKDDLALTKDHCLLLRTYRGTKYYVAVDSEQEAADWLAAWKLTEDAMTRFVLASWLMADGNGDGRLTEREVLDVVDRVCVSVDKDLLRTQFRAACDASPRGEPSLDFTSFIRLIRRLIISPAVVAEWAKLLAVQAEMDAAACEPPSRLKAPAPTIHRLADGSGVGVDDAASQGAAAPPLDRSVEDCDETVSLAAFQTYWDSLFPGLSPEAAAANRADVMEALHRIGATLQLDGSQAAMIDEDDESDLRVSVLMLQHMLTCSSNWAYEHSHQERVYQDMSLPLAAYWINTSHNTYLTGDQLQSSSSVDMYRIALQAGCKCVELDCWDSSDKEPVILHGHTLTSKIKFEDVVACVAKYAFCVNDYPLTLSLEVHCGAKGQQRMAELLLAYLGHLLAPPLPQPCEVLPSPEDLRGTILCKGPWLLRREATEAEDAAGASSSGLPPPPPPQAAEGDASDRSGARSQLEVSLTAITGPVDPSSPLYGGPPPSLPAAEEGASGSGRAPPLEEAPAGSSGGSSSRAAAGAPPDRPRRGDSGGGSSSQLKKAAIFGSATNGGGSSRGLQVGLPRSVSRLLQRIAREPRGTTEDGGSGSETPAAPKPKKHKQKFVDPALSALIVLGHGDRHKLAAQWKARQPFLPGAPANEMCSFGESQFTTKIKDLDMWGLYSHRQLTRTYPSGSRVTSNNYYPLLPWQIGCQMVALNFQTVDKPLRLYQARFKDNGGCGYVLKPPHLRPPPDQQLQPPPPTSPGADRLGAIAGCLSVTAVGAIHQVELQSASRNTSSRALVKAPYIKVQVFRNRHKQTCVTEPAREGGDPVWETPMRFTVDDAGVDLLYVGLYSSQRIPVLGVATDHPSKRDSMIGYCAVPVGEAVTRPGLRCFPLADKTGVRMHMGVLCRLAWTPAYEAAVKPQTEGVSLGSEEDIL